MDAVWSVCAVGRTLLLECSASLPSETGFDGAGIGAAAPDAALSIATGDGFVVLGVGDGAALCAFAGGSALAVVWWRYAPKSARPLQATTNPSTNAPQATFITSLMICFLTSVLNTTICHASSAGFHEQPRFDLASTGVRATRERPLSQQQLSLQPRAQCEAHER